MTDTTRSDRPTIVWFRQDLRSADNPALAAAAARGPVLPVYILDDASPGRWKIGGAARWWLHHSLEALRRSLGGLLLLRGDPRAILADLARETGAQGVMWNRCYEPFAIARDKAIKADFAARGIAARSFNAGLLHEPWDIATAAGGPFKVFTPFWRACLARPMTLPGAAANPVRIWSTAIGVDLDALQLLPRGPDWAAGWHNHWTPGEVGAAARLEAFIHLGLGGYRTLRDRPDHRNVSRLSPHLHWGEISPRQVRVRLAIAAGSHPSLDSDVEKLLAEIGWREFAHHLLYHFPAMPEANWRGAFDAYPWRESPVDLQAWQRGATGYPLVDAGMRELWVTGTMHNRVRMVTASFLVKHLRIDWRCGQDWFWDTLVDADLANNAAGWQWVAGSGADAAPYFRIFNPVTQGRKFDPDGGYVRRWCPELARLPAEHIHAPFEAPDAVLAAAGVALGRTYPRPIVSHAAARAAALAGYAAVKAAGGSGG